MEILQVLKYHFRSERLSFEEDWDQTIEEMSVPDIISESDTDQAMLEGRLHHVLSLLDGGLLDTDMD